jgi:hypothetical protein
MLQAQLFMVSLKTQSLMSKQCGKTNHTYLRNKADFPQFLHCLSTIPLEAFGICCQ